MHPRNWPRHTGPDVLAPSGRSRNPYRLVSPHPRGPRLAGRARSREHGPGHMDFHVRPILGLGQPDCVLAMTRLVSGDKVAAWFRQEFGRSPEGVWHAPGRVNIIGEHTDYNDGFVLPLALGTGVTVCGSRRRDGRLVLMSRQARTGAIPLSELHPGGLTGWCAYPAGVAWALREAGYPVQGASLAVDSDLPYGAGLSSSAALECAVALALTELSGLSVPRSDLVAITSRAENGFVGVPTGIMDQSAALLCKAGHALLLDCRTYSSTAVPFDPATEGRTLIIIDTRVRRALADGRYAARRGECETAARRLGVRSLRDVAGGLAQVADISDHLLRRRAWHVVEENRRVLQAAKLLQNGRVAAVGTLLSESHQSLRDDFEVSWPQADAAAEAALAAGADGARMVGGGFGGSVLALVPASRSAAVTSAVSACFAANRWQQPAFSPAVPSPSARRLK
jgi:galactokinase